MLTGNQSRQVTASAEWLSPADPFLNYNVARNARLEGTLVWFTQSSLFRDWKDSGSLLWIHGKCMRSTQSSRLHLDNGIRIS